MFVVRGRGQTQRNSHRPSIRGGVGSPDESSDPQVTFPISMAADEGRFKQTYKYRVRFAIRREYSVSDYQLHD